MNSIPKEYEWIKEGVKVRHVKMSVDNMWIADGLPKSKGNDEWTVEIKDLEITVPCEFLMTEDDPPLYDCNGNFPDKMMGPFYVLERDDGFWECGHNGSGNAAYGQTEREAMKQMLIQYDMVVGHLIDCGMAAGAKVAQLKKARAVLAEHSRALSMANHFLTIGNNGVSVEEIAEALLSLADAIGGV